MTTQSEYTPDTGAVRSAYTRAMRQAFIASTGEHIEEFDRWLAEHDRQVAEAAWTKGQDSCSDQYPWEDNPYRKEPE